MKIGIDLLWVRPGINGGTESFIRNLLEGFGRYDQKNEYVLFVSEDNGDSFRQYGQYLQMRFHVCGTISASQVKRIGWENLHLDNAARAESVDVMFIPVYSKPFTYGSGIPYVCVIHDLQAAHYPQYFGKGRRLFLRFMWWFACRTCQRVLTISEFCRQDLIARYPFARNKISTVYLPVITKESGLAAEDIERKFGIVRNHYFYCVSAMLPHKNLETLLRAMALLKKKEPEAKLVLSGVGGNHEEFDAVVKSLEIDEMVVLTGFVTNEERDCLYEQCEMFLFPSVFEGFGMPLIEAMRKGKNVVTTQTTCMREVTQGKAIYVEDPYDAEEWVSKIAEARTKKAGRIPFEQYELGDVSRRYLKILEETDGRNL